MDNSKQVILKILDIIEFSEDREKFADGFLTLIYKNALGDCLSSLPEDTQKLLAQRLSDQNIDPQIFSDTIMHYVKRAQFRKSLEKCAKATMDGYIKAILPTISEDQKKQIEDYFASQSDKTPNLAATQ